MVLHARRCFGGRCAGALVSQPSPTGPLRPEPRCGCTPPVSRRGVMLEPRPGAEEIFSPKGLGRASMFGVYLDYDRTARGIWPDRGAPVGGLPPRRALAGWAVAFQGAALEGGGGGERACSYRMEPNCENSRRKPLDSSHNPWWFDSISARVGPPHVGGREPGIGGLIVTSRQDRSCPVPTGSPPTRARILGRLGTSGTMDGVVKTGSRQHDPLRRRPGPGRASMPRPTPKRAVLCGFETGVGIGLHPGTMGLGERRSTPTL